jgi:hypothetical protein
LEIDLGKMVSETQLLQHRFTDSHEELTRRWSTLVEEFKSQVKTWSLTRPHRDEMEAAFLGQRRRIMSINGEFHGWTKRYNALQTRLQSELTPASKSDLATKLSDVRRLRHEILRNLDVEIPLLEDILNRFESAVNTLGSFNSV